MDNKKTASGKKDVAIYARVSTDKQSLSQQIDACERFIRYKDLNLIKTYSDTGSGKSYKDRPQFAELINELRLMRYDGVVVFRLDRLFRNVVEAVNFFQEWSNRGIGIYSISESLDTSTAIGRAMQNIILVLAELERENIIEATTQRLHELKLQGVKLGRPTLSSYQINKISKLRAGGKSYREIAGEMRISKSAVAKYLKEVKE